MKSSPWSLIQEAFLFFTCALGWAQPPQPTISWNGDAAGFWDVATNWRDSQGNVRVPNAADDVLIDRGSVRPLITIRSSQSVRSVTGTAPLVITGGGSLAIAAA